MFHKVMVIFSCIHKRSQIIGKRLKKREPIEIIFSSLSKLGTDSADLIG